MDREDLIRHLLTARTEIPTSSIGRLGRTALTALRVQRAAASSVADHESDLETVTKIVDTIGGLKGIAMKMGQMMSYIDVALPSDLREALSVLQTHAQPMPITKVHAIIRQELPVLAEALLAELEITPVAAASIGQVHRGRLPDGTRVAVKVQYPEVEEAIRSDFKPAALGSAIASLVYSGAKIDGLVAEARARFLEECDYRHEALAQQRFAMLYEGHPTIEVPRVHPEFCSRRVLTSTWISGLRFESFVTSNARQETRDRLGEALFAFYIGSLFEHGLYNCDPHPGNYLLLEGGRIGMLDYGCTRSFERPFVAKLAKLTLAVHRDERDALHQAFVDLGMIREGTPYDFETARDLVRAFHGPMLEDRFQDIRLGQAMHMREVLQKKRELMKLTLPGEFLFLFRIRFGLMAVLAQLGARANWRRLEARWAHSALEASLTAR